MTRRKRPAMREGLEGLLGQTADLVRAQERVTTLPTSSLHPGALQPRKVFGEAALLELTESIRQQGVLQPLLVRPVHGGHEIVAGERRWRAAQAAGLEEVPVLIRELDDQQALIAGLVENLQRENLNPYEEVEATVHLIALALGTTFADGRARLYAAARGEGETDVPLIETAFAQAGLSNWRSFTSNKLRILNWPEAVLEAMKHHALPYTLGGVIAAAPREHQSDLLARALAGASIRELKEHLKSLQGTGSAATGEARVMRIGRRLGSPKWWRGLKAAEQRELNKWLDRLPDTVKHLLEE